ncbi:hypothetical protein Aph02nite_53380 [Actinoplanes philippinensis]|uniref:Uncharacterized protein n=2 Tax=Actinoplanes philippinensis TaxID=35752 RepID=A0A1I2IGT9_9ACTN|nr:hypothetical protein Aph02nite_53380 [Actinoplanes philippinensis]SFF41454.1 hypothetical protein SAMN05421541_11023 [Actinoplanes philippinensis]
MTGIAKPLEGWTRLGRVEPSVRLTPAFRLGAEDLDIGQHLGEKPGRQHNLEPVRVVLDEAMDRWGHPDSAASDTWVGPRLHAALRLSRREASDRATWRFLGLWAADYVRWRFGPEPGQEDPEQAAKVERFVGPHSKQALARLWWMTETFRNGTDYSQAALALTNQDIINNLFRMSIANHRPTALAALAVLPRSKDGTSLPNGRAANALAKATNATASTLLLDLLAPDEQADVVARARWEAEASDYDARAYLDTLPEGPDDGEVPAESVELMKKLLSELLTEAPIRGQVAA